MLHARYRPRGRTPETTAHACMDARACANFNRFLSPQDDHRPCTDFFYARRAARRHPVDRFSYSTRRYIDNDSRWAVLCRTCISAAWCWIYKASLDNGWWTIVGRPRRGDNGTMHHAPSHRMSTCWNHVTYKAMVYSNTALARALESSHLMTSRIDEHQSWRHGHLLILFPVLSSSTSFFVQHTCLYTRSFFVRLSVVYTFNPLM